MTSPLSKEERLQAYKTVLEKIIALKDSGERGIRYGVCEELCLIVTGEYVVTRSLIDAESCDGFVERYFPEFWKQRKYKNPDIYFFWWKQEDFNSRIQALQRCINKLS